MAFSPGGSVEYSLGANTPGAVHRWRTANHRIRNARARRPQLNRRVVRLPADQQQKGLRGGNSSRGGRRSLRPGFEALAVIHHTAAALRLPARLRLAELRVTVLRSGAERRTRSFPQVRARGSRAAWPTSVWRWERVAGDPCWPQPNPRLQLAGATRAGLRPGLFTDGDQGNVEFGSRGHFACS